MTKAPKLFRANPPQPKRGGSSTKRDHTRAYQRLRLSVLDDEPLCRYCQRQGRVTASTIVDHRIALSLGGSNDRSNLVGACQDCNDAKGKAEAAFVRKGYDARDVMRDATLSRWILDLDK